MSEQYEVRKIPKKSIYFMIAVVVAGVIVYFVIANKKASKVQMMLALEGYKNTTDIIVFAQHQVLNESTNIKGDKYSIRFKNLDNGKICKGFVYFDYKGNHDTDLECK